MTSRLGLAACRSSSSLPAMVKSSGARTEGPKGGQADLSTVFCILLFQPFLAGCSTMFNPKVRGFQLQTYCKLWGACLEQVLFSILLIPLHFGCRGVWEFLDSQFVVKAVAKKIQSVT